MSKWKKERLINLCDRIGDGIHGTPEYVDVSNIYFINGNNLKNGKIFIDADTKKVEQTELIKNFVPLNSNTLLMSINGTLGSLAFYNNENVLLGKSSAYMNFKTNINRFYYYYFQLENIQKYFYNVATGSTIKNLSLQSLQTFEVPVPEDNEWKRIASVLSALDDKIELNNRINAELEAMAKTLYDYWFVQFDFPDANGKPYKSSGGKMMYSKELKREIPEGWEVKAIGGYIPSTGGFAFKSIWWTESGIPVVKIKDIQENYTLDLSDCSFVDEDKLAISKKFELKAGDIVIAMTGATVGKYAIVPYTNKPLFLNQRVGVFKSSENNLSKLPFLINSLNQPYFREMVFTLASGAAQPNISNEQINNINLLLPASKYIDLFNNKLNSVYLSILKNQQENQHLASLRDWLLPMLMNGQIGFKEDAKKETPIVSLAQKDQDQRFELWLSNQGLAARGEINELTLREIFNAMDEDDK